MKTYWTSLATLAGSGLTVAALMLAGPAAAGPATGGHEPGATKSVSVTAPSGDHPVTGTGYPR